MCIYLDIFGVHFTDINEVDHFRTHLTLFSTPHARGVKITIFAIEPKCDAQSSFSWNSQLCMYFRLNRILYLLPCSFLLPWELRMHFHLLLAPIRGTFTLIVWSIAYMFNTSFIVDWFSKSSVNITRGCPATFSLWQVRFVSCVLPLLEAHTGCIIASTMYFLLWIPSILTRSQYVILALLILVTKCTFLSPLF